MNQKIVYSKTGKGVLEIKNKAGKLSRELAKVLSLIDGKSAVADLVAKTKLTEPNLARCLKQLEDGGYIKEFASLSGAMSSASSSGASSYVDDLDFTASLMPGKRIYSNAQSEFRASESADRQRAEVEATRKRQEAEEQKKQQAKSQAREEAIRMARIEAERKSKEAAAIKARQQAELNEKRQAAEMAKTTRDLAKILEAERQALDKSDSKRNEEKARKAKEEAERKGQEEERRKREEEERHKREEEERRKREEEERRKREEEERRKREEEERRKREGEERRKREEEERRKREEEERRKRDEEERRKREGEERRKREEEDRQREEDERREREEEERQREEEEKRRREEEDRRREEEDRRRGGEDRRRREQEDRRREEEESALPILDVNSFEDIEIPSVPEVSESASASFDLPSLSASDSGESFAVDFDKHQEMLREQAEVQERRIQEAEEARLALERAEREEDARIESERRSAVEAEMRTRVEQEKADRADRERNKKEEYERKIHEEENRKKQEIQRKFEEDQARIETERKQREEELVRRRKGVEDEDRKRRELKALKKSGKLRSPIERMVPIVVGVVAVMALAVGVLHVMPMSGYIPAVQKLASDNIGEPVTIGSMKLSLLSGLQFKLTNVSIGATQDVTLNGVTVSPELGSLFGDRLVVNSIEAEGGKIVKEALWRLPSWRESSASDPRMKVRSIALRGVNLNMRSFDLPRLNVDVALGRDGRVISARIEATDGSVITDIESRDGRVGVSIRVNNWTPPFGTPIKLTDFNAKGSVTGSVLNLSEWDATVYGGQVNGSAQISWESEWRASSQFNFVRVATEELLDAFTKTANVSGSANGTASFSARSGSLDTLLDRPTLRASFVVQKGNLGGVDLVRALQVGRSGSQGGSTKFEELKGDVTISNGQYSYRNVILSAGILSAHSDFNIASDEAVSGKVGVELRSSAQRLNANLNVTGTLKAVLLRP